MLASATIEGCMHNLPDTLDGWLNYCESLHPRNIEIGLERVGEVA